MEGIHSLAALTLVLGLFGILLALNSGGRFNKLTNLRQIYATGKVLEYLQRSPVAGNQVQRKDVPPWFCENVATPEERKAAFWIGSCCIIPSGQVDGFPLYEVKVGEYDPSQSGRGAQSIPVTWMMFVEVVPGEIQTSAILGADTTSVARLLGVTPASPPGADADFQAAESSILSQEAKIPGRIFRFRLNKAVWVLMFATVIVFGILREPDRGAGR